jgi:hypothetical protein
MAGLGRIQQIQYYQGEFQKQLRRATNFICIYWYGHDIYFKTDLIKRQFFGIINVIKTTHAQRINNVIANKPVLDVMYFMLDNEYYNKSYYHRVYILTVASMLFEEKRLYFSTTERKYTYMGKISKISREVISELECRNRRKTIFNLTCTAVTCLLGYILR